MIEINSLHEIEKFAQELRTRVSLPFEIGLIGQLGAGKTTLTKLLAKALGLSEELTSPSYIYCADYQFENKILEHWDLYRCLTLPDELAEQPEENTIRIIEWIDKFPELSKRANLLIEIKIPDIEHFPEKRFILAKP